MAAVDLKKRRLVAENSKWKIFFDHLADTQGNEVLDYVVVAGQAVAANKVAGVAVLPVLDDRIVLIRSYRHALASELWELPRGFVDTGETPAQAALRELNEETGLRCDPTNLEPLGFFAPEASTIAARGALFAAMQCEGSLKTATDEIGLVEVCAFTRKEVRSLVTQGEIEDAGTLIAYYRYCELRAAGR